MNKSSDDRQHQPVVADAETYAAQAVPERNNPPVAAATETHPPTVHSLDASSEHLAALVDLQQRVVAMQMRARGRAVRGKMKPWIRGWLKGQNDALGEVYDAISAKLREGPRGGNVRADGPEDRP